MTDLTAFSIEDEHSQSSLFPWWKYFILSDGFGELDHLH